MSFTFTVLVTLALGLAVLIIYGKQNIKKIAAPLILLLAGDFLFLYAKLAAGDPFLSLILNVPAFILLLIPSIWFAVLLIKSKLIKKDKRKIAAILLSLAVSTAIVFVPSLSREDKFKLYQEDFHAVSDAIFQAYDEGKVSVGEQFASPPYSSSLSDRLRQVFSNEVIGKMKKLNRSAGVYT